MRGDRPPYRGAVAVTSRRSWVAPDAAVALLAAAFLLAVTPHIPVDAGNRPVDAIAVVTLAAAGLSVGLDRRRPLVALGIVTVALSVYLAREYQGGPIWVTGWSALAALSWRTNRRTGFTGAAVFCGALLAVAAVVGDLAPLVHLVFVGWSVAAVLIGDALRARHERARELERTRDEEARRRVAEERLRIARDLHDSVAHAMATINVQAGAAAHVVDRRPEAAKEALAAIQRASADVLDELAALLGLLRSSDEAADRQPTPTLAAVEDLVATTRASGVPVTLEVDGAVGHVPPAVATAAYRIVQESLTNVIRHAPGASAAVRIAAAGDRLHVEVMDDGGLAGAREAAATPSAGMGLRGMRERAGATGGTLDAGPGPGGGFVVRASWGAT